MLTPKRERNVANQSSCGLSPKLTFTCGLAMTPRSAGLQSAAGQDLDYLAAHRPVYREPRHGVVMVTGHEEAITVLRSPDVFSSATLIVGPDPWSLLPERPDGDDITEFVNAHREYLPQNDQIVTADPPSHTAQRALLMGLITPKRLKENEEFIWRLTDRQLDYLLPLGTAEIIADYAQPYTLLVIADLLGVPEEDHAMLLARRGIAQMPGTRPGVVSERTPAGRTATSRAQHAGDLLRLLLREDRRAPRSSRGTTC